MAKFDINGYQIQENDCQDVQGLADFFASEAIGMLKREGEVTVGGTTYGLFVVLKEGKSLNRYKAIIGEMPAQ